MIERVILHNAETDFAVRQVKVCGQAALMSVLVTLAEVTAGSISGCPIGCIHMGSCNPRPPFDKKERKFLAEGCKKGLRSIDYRMSMPPLIRIPAMTDWSEIVHQHAKVST